MRDVNRARALTVEALMKPPELRLTSQSLDAALAEMARAGAAYGYVIEDGRFAGVVTQEALNAANDAPGENQTLAEIAEDLGSVSVEQAIEEALPLLLDAPAPVAVVDDKGRLKGVVAQQDVGAMLARPAEGEEGVAR